MGILVGFLPVGQSHPFLMDYNEFGHQFGTDGLPAIYLGINNAKHKKICRFSMPNSPYILIS